MLFHFVNILKEVFNVKDGKYIKKNSYWKSINIISLIDDLPKEKVKDIMIALNNIKNTYKELSQKYQSNKIANNIPLK